SQKEVMMMVRRSIRIVVAALGAALALASTSALAAPTTCATFLGSGANPAVFSCTVTPFGGPSFHDCFELESTNLAAAGFGLLTVRLGEEVAADCICDASGSSSAPKLETSPSTFICAGLSGSSGFIGMSGKIAAGGKRIMMGNAFDGFANAYAF